MECDYLHNARTGMKVIDEVLMYQVLSIPSYSGQERWMQKYLMEHAMSREFTAGIDDKGNIYMCKGIVADDEFFPCLTAHMDTVHSRQIPFI